MLPVKKPWKAVVKEHLWGPTGSVVVHIIVVFALIKFVQFKQTSVSETVHIKRIEAKDIDIPPPEKIEIQEIKDLEFTDDIPFDGPVVDAEVPTEEVSDAPESETDLSDLEVMSDIQSVVTMTGVMQGRVGDGRDRMLKEFGGNKLTEQAVVRALEFLKSVQEENGSWDKNSVGITGLGLLTFLAHGETPSSDKYGPVVENAIRFLISSINDTGWTKAGRNPYHHAIATYGLAEAYGMTRIPALREHVEKMCRHIIDNQQTSGGWAYEYDKNSDRNDSSVSAWQVQALKAANISGAQVPGLKEALKKSLEGLMTLHNDESGVFYYATNSRRTNIGLTGLGLLCHQLLGHAEDKVTRDGLAALADATVDWNAKGHPAYAWYYVTQAKFHSGGDTWKKWNQQIAPTLIKQQNADGSWLMPAEEKQGKVYCTTLGALSLQVYYRFLPTFQEKALAPPATTLEAKDDIEIDIEI